jgi:hypothetical protein
MMMLKTAVGFDADRVISAIVDSHDSGDQLYDRVKLDKNNIKAIYEKDNSPKVNHYVPGTNIKILKDKYIFLENKHAPIINFAWHISSEIKAYLRKKKINNKIIDIVSQKDFSS